MLIARPAQVTGAYATIGVNPVSGVLYFSKSYLDPQK
jgi:hypothetical protein